MTLAVCWLVALAVPALADLEIPEEWIGVWEMDIEIYDCETNGLVFSTTNFDTICPGSVFEDPDGSSIPLECTGSVDANSYTTHCEGSEVVGPGCTANFVYDVSSTRSGNSFSSTGTTTITYTGDCPLIPDTCQRVEISGMRISDDMGPCEATPVEKQPWATVKSFYR